MAATIQNIELPKKPRALDSSMSVQEVSQELVTNGSMEADANWSNQNSPTTNERSSTEANGGTYSRKVVGDSAGDGIKSDTFSLVEGRTYQVEFYYYLTTGSNNLLARLQDGDGSDLGVSEVFGTKDTWTKITFTRIAESSGDASYFKIYQNMGGSSTFYVDDVSVKEIENFSNNNHGQIYSGRALEFDGVTDYLDTSIKFDSTNFTFAAWIKANDDNTNKVIIDCRDGDNDGIMFQCTTDEKIKLGLNFTDTTGNAIVANSWARVVATYNGSTVSIYINGVLDKTASVSETFSINDDTLTIGRKAYGGSNYFDGLMSDVQVWTTAWTADDAAYDFANPESLALNASGTALTEGNLKIWYPMQDGHRGQQSYILDGANTGIVSALIDHDFSTDTTSEWATADTSSPDDRGAISYVADGFLRVTYTGLSGAVLNKPSALTDGVSYKITFRAKGTHDAVFSSVGNNGDIGYAVSNPTLTTDWQDYEFYITADDSSTLRLYQSGTPDADQTLDIDNILVQPINDKHHATTVFYGDNTIVAGNNDRDMGGSNNWNAYGTGTTKSVTGDKLRVVTTTAEVVQGAELPVANSGTSVVGRTYRIRAKLKRVSGLDPGTIVIYYGGVGKNVTGGSTLGEITDIEAEYEVTITSIDATGNLIIVNNSNTTALTFEIDDVVVQEVGVATGWTDADQQLDIAQPALQSYNEMGMFLGVDDGTDSDISCGSDASIDNVFDSGGTFSAWIYTNGIGANDYGRIFDKNQIYFYLQSESGDTAQLAFTNITSGTPNTVARSTDRDIKYGQWQHVTITYNASSPGTAPVMYINGVAIGVTCPTGAGTRIDDAGNSLYIGNNAAGTRTFNGCITEASFWEEILTAAEVLELYNEGKALDATTHSQADELKAYWRNNGLSTWTDLSTNTNNGTVNNITETLLIPQGVDGSRDAQGFIMNRARNTSSANMPSDESKIECGPFTDILADGASTASIECWVKADDAAGSGDYATFAGERSGKNILLCQHQKEAIALYRLSTSGNITLDSNVTVLDGDWHHVAFTFGDGDGVARLYVDGTQRVTETDAGETLAMDDASFNVGGGDDAASDRYFNGTVDGVKIYNKALDSTEVTRNYNATKGSHR